ncbi:MAG: methyltransferase domain-containing protein [Acidobacteriota bacterium]|nr:methyltransferase domain-containing protein [Acidobacteriota bacterium]
MARTSLNSPYRWLARYYDRFFSAFRSPMDAARTQLLGTILPHVSSACDLACGTGTTALSMARAGLRMSAVDLSPDMCRLTREKFRGARLPVRVIRADMRSFRLPRPVDLVTCECDALNHVPRKSGLVAVAKAVARALNPGGWFFFDVNNRAGFASYWRLTAFFEQPGAALIMRNGQDATHDHAWCDVEWFFREGALWRRRRERIDEVCWSAAEIRRALRAAGFDRIRAWDAAPFFPAGSLITPGCRSIYLARKK